MLSLLTSGCVDVIRNDSLIRLFARHQLLRKGNDVTFTERNQIRGKLRFLGRLCLALHEVTSEKKTLSQFITPGHYDDCVNAVLQLREQNQQMAFTLGHYIKKICYIKLAEGIKAQNESQKKESKDFMDLYLHSWSEVVASSTVRMQQLNKINKQVLLPTIEDLDKLSKFIEAETTKQTSLNPKDINYTKLQKLVVAGLLLFNKRRPAEVTDITVQDYRTSFDMQDDREEVMASLSPEEKALAGR